jgi:hypothetical protein
MVAVTRTDESPPVLPGIVETADDHERPSITEVNGSVAKFDMAYSPKVGERRAFGPPLRHTLPSYVFLAGALVFAAVVATAYASSSNSQLFIWIVEGDRHRQVGAQPLAWFISICALGTVLRSHLRGVIISQDGIEMRTMLALGLPKVRKMMWAQIDRIVIDERGVMLELWNGEYERLPAVKDHDGLAKTLEAIAGLRKKQVTRLQSAEKR